MEAGQFCRRPEVVSDDSLQGFVQIGCGGFGQIYRAKHTGWVMDVAIKLLLYKEGSSSSIHREADLMFQGGNPNVMRIFGLYEGRLGEARRPMQCGLVMEFMAMGSVSGLLQTLDGAPPWPLGFRMAHQIGLGMNFLHHLSPPLLHLDLKPSNVLLNHSLDAKITDFGLSRVARSVSRCSGEEGEGGTLSYMPPEALRSINYKPSTASDVYSYGVLLWSIITGKEPYGGAASSLVRFRIPVGDRPDLTLIPPLSETAGLGELVELMRSCWDQDAHRRPSFLDCVNVTEKILEMHQRGVSDAVRDVLKHLEGDVCSSLRSLQISRNTHTEERPPQVLPCVTGSLPKQESGAGLTHTVNTDPSPRLTAPLTPPRTTQRQTSTPGNFNIRERSRRESGTSTAVHINMSNAFGVQIGNNNCMNIIQRTRQRHQTK